jgi:hypothetical protein
MAYGDRDGLLLAGGRGRIRLGHSAFLLNPGSVGQSRQWLAFARAVILDLERQEARFVAVRYDSTATAAELSSHRLPREARHRRPGRRQAAQAALREMSRAARRARVQLHADLAWTRAARR